MCLDGIRKLQRHLRLSNSAETHQGQLLAVVVRNQLLFQLFQLLHPTDEFPILEEGNAIGGGYGASYSPSVARETEINKNQQTRTSFYSGTEICIL